MSNPAVIQLASSYIGNTEIRIEDNIAEAIHLHIGMVRIDLTVKEFLDISDKMLEAANQLISAENFKFENFDPIFLNYYSTVFPDLEKVEVDEIRLGDIIALKNRRLPFYRKLCHCRDYKALEGNTDELEAYDSQVNTIGQSNLDRLNSILNSIKEKGYPYNGEYIILRNNQNVILDGQHRASCLLFLYGPDHKIPVLRFKFKDNKYDIKDWHPWIKALIRKLINRAKKITRRITGDGYADL